MSVETEDGETLEHRVPKPEFRKRAALFPFDAGPGLREEDAWIPYIVPIGLELDLGADEFFEPITPDLFAPRLAQRGYPELRNVPLVLKQEVSEEFRAELIATGTVDRAEDEYQVTMTLYKASNGSQVSETVHQGPDLLTLIDTLSVELSEALEIPGGTDIVGLPVRGRLTEDEAALEAFGRGSAALLAPQLDLDLALEQFRVATTLDPTFALAQYQFASLLNHAGRPGEAIAPIRAAFEHDYRFPERTKFPVRVEYYLLTGQMAEAFTTIERWKTFHPEDPGALGMYSQVQMARADWAGLLETLETLYRLSPGEHSLLQLISDAQRRLGDDEQALSTLERYVEEAPDDYSGYLEMARIQRRRGEHESAREHLGRALSIRPNMLELMLEFASLDLDMGSFDEALRRYEEASNFARTPGQKADVLVDLKGYYRFRGQLEEAIRTTNAWLEEASMALTPAEIAQDRFSDIDLYLDAGRGQDANLLFDALRSQQPPMGEFLIPHYRIHIELGAGDSEAARSAYRAAMAAIEAHDLGAARPRVIGDLGRIDELDGDYDSAIERYREAMKLEPGRNLHRETGRALRAAGRLDEAESELREALRRRPAEPHAHLEMALVLEMRGEAEKAREHLRSALRAWEPADESFEPARAARAKLVDLETAS